MNYWFLFLKQGEANVFKRLCDLKPRSLKKQGCNKSRNLSIKYKNLKNFT